MIPSYLCPTISMESAKKLNSQQDPFTLHQAADRINTNPRFWLKNSSLAKGALLRWQVGVVDDLQSVLSLGCTQTRVLTLPLDISRFAFKLARRVMMSDDEAPELEMQGVTKPNPIIAKHMDPPLGRGDR